MFKKNRIGSLALWYLTVLIFQLAGGVLTAKSIYPWYAELNKPSWNPPNWVFGPVWTLIFIMIALAIWLIGYKKNISRTHTIAYVLFFIQLFLNLAWSLLFFKLHLIGWALIELGVLILFIIALSWLLFSIRKISGFLFLPYLIWAIYALTLNVAIYNLN